MATSSSDPATAERRRLSRLYVALLPRWLGKYGGPALQEQIQALAYRLDTAVAERLGRRKKVNRIRTAPTTKRGY